MSPLHGLSRKPHEPSGSAGPKWRKSSQKSMSIQPEVAPVRNEDEISTQPS